MDSRVVLNALEDAFLAAATGVEVGDEERCILFVGHRCAVRKLGRVLINRPGGATPYGHCCFQCCDVNFKTASLKSFGFSRFIP
jgi:hypothetical protein